MPTDDALAGTKILKRKHAAPNSRKRSKSVLAAETRRMMTATQRRFRRLPIDQKEALMLVVIEGVSYQDAAEKLHISTDELKERLLSGRETLRRLIEEDRVRAEHLAQTLSRPWRAQ